MAIQSERPSTRPFFFRKRRDLRIRKSPLLSGLGTSGDKDGPHSPHKYLAFLGKLATPFGVLLLCLVLWIVSGYVVGKLSPGYMVTVQPFETLPEVANRGSLSGKSASDLVVDIVNDAASHAALFHGTDYYRYDSGVSAQPVSLRRAIKVPIQTSYGIELQGISVDKVLQLYHQARYEQWIVGGEVVSTPNGLVGRIRLNKAHEAKSWETLPSVDVSPAELVRGATYRMLAEEVPELLGQSYLQQGKYQEAETVFRQWAINDPQNWRPSYYLSLAYSYQDKVQEARTFAKWSTKIAGVPSSRNSQKRVDSAGSQQQIAFKLAQATEIALQTTGTSDPQKLDILQQKLNTLGHSQSTLGHLLNRSPANVDYEIQRAKVLDKESLIALDRNSPKAYDLSRQAIASLNEAIQSVPENGGLHEQRAILLMNLATIMRKQAKGSAAIRDTELEEVREYTRALELRPEQDSALWGAVYADINLGNNEDAIDLARTISLLRPDSKAVGAAYVVALARAIKTPWNEPERENEMQYQLKRFLESKPDQKVEESQLAAIWDALVLNNDREGLELVETASKRLFPQSSFFQERKLQSYFVGLSQNDGQVGS